MANNAFLTNVNLPLGTEFDDGIRNGPVLDRTIITSSGYQPYSYTQWGQGLLNSANNNYNIIPRGPSGAGNVIVAIAPAAAGNLTLAQDTYVTSLTISGTSSPSNLSQYIQIDWPRALSVVIAGGNFNAAATITVFGADYYGVPLQEALTFQNAGTYQMKKAFYQINSVYYNGAASGGATMAIQTTDVMGLPFRVKSPGDIYAIRWGNFSDLSNNNPTALASPLIGKATLAGTPGTIVVNTPNVTVLSDIQVTRNTPGGTLGNLSVPTASIINNTSFVINSDANETSTVDWLITNLPFASGGRAFVAGVAVVNTTAVKANSNIQLAMTAFGTAHGQWYVSSIIPGVSFTVTSTANTETSPFDWAIMPDNFVSGVSANLVTGTIFVPTNAVQSNSKIFLTYKTLGGTPGILSVPDAYITPGVGFTITSSSNIDTSTVNWTILQNIPNLTQGTATLVAGTVTVPTTAVLTNSDFILTYNTPTLPATYVRVSAINNGVSFTITAQATTDVSTINWAIFPADYILPAFLTPLGTFTPADDTPATNTTGDVRGTYLPSTPANGVNVLHFATFVSGFDNFVNQQADGNLPSGGTVAAPLTRGTITINDQVGVQQYYTGTHA